MGCAVIFGGTGFIGVFLADLLATRGGYSRIYLVDPEPLAAKAPFRARLLAPHAGIAEIRSDVRQAIGWTPPEPVALIANLAAVHREPGHEPAEYFETNLRGAEHVCAFADRVGCDELIFASSISPYGISEAPKDEHTLPVPVTAYGSSKLVAEKIHRLWQNSRPESRRLVIARPGVVFGPSEGGNVTRLVRGVKRGYFCYTGNRATRKAGIYVKDLCRAMLWTLERQRQTGESVSLFNGSLLPGPSVEEYVLAACATLGVQRHVPNLPYPALLAAAHVLDVVLRPVYRNHPFAPLRIRKLVRSNDIRPGFLSEHGFPYRYSLQTAMADWYAACPEDWA